VTDANALESLGVEIVRGDIRNPGDVERATANCRLVFHLAARTAHGNIPAKHIHSINLEGTANVAHAAGQAGVARLVLASSTRVYGLIKNRAIDERTPVKPDPGYPRSKVQAEQLVLSHHMSDELPVVVARISTVFGPGSKNWLGLFQSILTGRYRLIGSGNNYYQPCDVSDIVEGLFLCGTVQGIEGRTYIIAGAEPITLRDMMGCIQDELGVTTSQRPLPGAPLHMYKFFNDVVRACGGKQLPRFDRVEFFLNDRKFDLTRARGELGYIPKVSLKEAIHRTAERYREQGYL